MDIEIFPAEKSCEQGCSICPLARKDNTDIATKINRKVQTSFSLLEHALKSIDMAYTIHTSPMPHLFPAIKHPELIEMTRFETEKNIGINGNARVFSNNVQSILEKYSIAPRTLGFSVVPQFPVISEIDIANIRRILNELVYWHFDSTDRTIEITVRTNLIKPALFAAVAKNLFAADEMYSKPFIQRYMGPLLPGKDHITQEILGGDMYYNEYTSACCNRKIVMINRVIAPKQVAYTSEMYVDQAMEFCVLSKYVPDILIAPKGIMFMHSSLGINNPVLWISHSDFNVILKKALKKRPFSITEFIKENIILNIAMYEYIHDNKKDVVLLNNDFLSIFEQLRPTYQE